MSPNVLALLRTFYPVPHAPGIAYGVLPSSSSSTSTSTSATITGYTNVGSGSGSAGGGGGGGTGGSAMTLSRTALAAREAIRAAPMPDGSDPLDAIDLDGPTGTLIVLFILCVPSVRPIPSPLSPSRSHPIRPSHRIASR